VNKLKSLVHKNFIYKRWYNSIILKRQNKALQEWKRLGMQLPPPHEYKQSLIIDHSIKYGLSVFIETGTFLGYMVEVLKYQFDKLISIELDLSLFEKAKRKFVLNDHIFIYQGDSTHVLPEILKKLEVPALFWLDGHYSEGITAKGELNTPIISELRNILDHSIKKHLILIDDARCFDGKNDYPTIEELRSLVKRQNPSLNFSVENDIIRIHP
jgi:hypothetical protein